MWENILWVVKFYDAEKRFGFISVENKDYFVHKSQLLNQIKQGDTVQFNLVASERKNWKLEAHNVCKI